MTDSLKGQDTTESLPLLDVGTKDQIIKARRGNGYDTLRDPQPVNGDNHIVETLDEVISPGETSNFDDAVFHPRTKRKKPLHSSSSDETDNVKKGSSTSRNAYMEYKDTADILGNGGAKLTICSIKPRNKKRGQDPPERGFNSYVVESKELISGETGHFGVERPLQPPNTEGLARMKTREQSLIRQSPDQIDNASVLEDDEYDMEPSFSWDNPATTEECDEASQDPDNTTQLTSCFFLKSSWIEKKFNKLLLAVTYHETEQLNKILNEEEPSTLVQLLTKRDVNGKPCIMKAISRQSLSCIQPLLEQLKSLDFDLYGIDKMAALESDDKRNILHDAAQTMRDTEILNTIDNYPWMEQLADSADNCGTTPLIVACQYQNHVMARRLVNYKAKIDHVDNKGFSPIYWATSSGSAETLKFFLVHGVSDSNDRSELFQNPKLYNEKGTILRAILESRSPETLQVCLESRNGENDIKECLTRELDANRAFIHLVCETPLVKLVQLAIDKDSEQILKRLDNDDVTPLMKATESKQLDIVKEILSTNPGKKTLSFQKKSTKETALMIACKKGFHEIVEFIMENSDKDMFLGQLDQDRRNVFHHSAKDVKILPVMIEICKRTEKYKNYKDFLISRDNDGYVSLHHAASSGSHENVTLLLENDVPYNIPSAGLGRTALHYAACSNFNTVKALLEFVKERYDADKKKQFIDAVDSRLQTSLHIAASLAKWQTVSYLLKNGATMKCDKENETPLHLAAASGCKRTVQLLIQSNPSMVNNENRVGETPAIYAAVSGETGVLQMLLNNNATLWAKSHDTSVDERRTCLDWAVDNKCSETAKAILQLENWKDVMNKSDKGADGLLARMVIYMPNVAIEVLDKCKEKKKYEATYDFFALQTKGEMSRSCGERSTSTSYVKSMQALEAMANYSRNDCLNHTVVKKFVRQKWLVRALKWYVFCLLVYTAFLVSFTTYITMAIEGTCSADDPCVISCAICYVFVVLSVIKESLQLFHRRFQYLCTVSTYLELVMYICVFIFLPNEKKSNLQRQAGAIAIFLGWINYTWFLKRFPTYGIYIIMAKKIFVTFIKVFVPVSFFIMAFSMTFFVLLHEEDGAEGFENVVRSFVTSFAMMGGEVDYREVFLKQTRIYSNFVLILIFLILFLVLISILLMNLLTGLAVGDIGVIMRKSLASKRIEQAKMIVELDKYLNQYPCLRASFIGPLTIPQKAWAMRCVRTLMDKIFPHLDIEEEKKNKKTEECDCFKMQEQLNSMQNTLESIKHSLKESSPGLTERRSRERIQKRRTTTL